MRVVTRCQPGGGPGYYVVPTRNLGIFNNYVAKNGVSLAKAGPFYFGSGFGGSGCGACDGPLFSGPCCRAHFREKGIPLTAGFHCQAENFSNHIFLMNAKLVNRWIYRFFYRRLYQYCACVHLSHQFICDLFERETKPTHHYVISNGVNRALCTPGLPTAQRAGGKYVILSTGRYSREKAQWVLIDAVAVSHRDQIQLILAGRAPNRRRSSAGRLSEGFCRPFTASTAVRI